MSQPSATRAVLGVEVSSPSLLAAHAEATGRAAAVQQRLRTAGVRVGDVRLDYFGVSPEYELRDMQGGRVRGYVVCHTPEVCA